ncbi:prion-like-(Q/N-rich) domain-bearing protein 25 [Anopheles maculipalpis]|uniref:prion-like-(Q/N-rich) domain-bearing protein 25 n=1 Tax=Anopheles maculipalpis TaxID=1496333 RepID=UPI00215960F5|nr:prion-like-(Q/N-rich) domain-bearing protein 25 [Anopheles maculipalpis]
MTRLGVLVVVLLAVQGSRSIIWPCEDNSDCKAENAHCSIFGYCQCPAGYVFSTDVTRCLPESAYGVACQEAVQCSHMLTGAKCEAGVCTCDSDYTYVRGRCRKLVDLGQPCSDDIDCFFSHNRESVVCHRGSCECADGFYRRSSNVCRRRVTNGEECLVHQDCDGENLRCVNQHCTDAAAQTRSLRDVAIQTSAEVVEESNGAEGLPAKDAATGEQGTPKTRDAETNTETVAASGKRVQINTKRSANDCEKCRKFGDPCVDEGVECPEVPYSVCRMGQCHCQDGYYNQNGRCMAELGEYAHDVQYCDNSAVFRNNRCTCRNDQFYDNNMRMCLKSALGINTSCTQQSQCSPYAAYCPTVSPKRCACHPYARYDEATELCVEKEGYEGYCERDTDCTLANSRCSNEKTCVCKTNYFYVDERCKASKGAECETETDCAFEEAVCESPSASEGESVEPSEPKQCNCRKGHFYQPSNNRCLKEAEEYGEECSADEQCQPLLGELGQCIEGKCQCNENEHHYKDGKCNVKLALDSRCSKTSECFVEDDQDNVECRNSACQCKFDYSPDVERQKCVRPSGKNSSDRPSALKVITLMLTSAAVLITGSALRDAYYG